MVFELTRKMVYETIAYRSYAGNLINSKVACSNINGVGKRFEHEDWTPLKWCKMWYRCFKEYDE